MRRSLTALGALGLVGGSVWVAPAPAGADGIETVGTSAELIAAFQDGTTDQIDVTADITLTAPAVRPAGADDLLVQGGGHTITAAPNSRILESDVGTGALVLDDITLTGASPDIGQGIAVFWRGTDALDRTSITLQTAAIVDNEGVSAGGAILADNADVFVTDSVISGNTAPGNGGGIWSNSGNVTVTRSLITGNTTNNGGGIQVNSANLTLTDSTVTDNTTNAGGGGASVGGSATITRSTISGNHAGTSGGGLQIGGGLTLVDSTVSGNESGLNPPVGDGSGGGIQATSDVTLVSSTVTGNVADGETGGIHATATTLLYSTIASNTGTDGANLRTFDGDGVTMFGTVIADPSGSGSCANLGPTTSQGYNVEEGGDTCGLGGGAGDVANAPDPQLGALRDNGGPTQTRTPAFSSPLIDAIPLSACDDGGAVTTDQRGAPRPFGVGCDVGAVEGGEAVPEPPPAVPVPAAPPFTG